MTKMGFDSKWIGMILVCFSLMLYSILVNGCPQQNLKPSRGIR